jgi:hypothetical protein
MTDRVSRYRTFFAELKRRGVFKVAALYGAGAFAVLQGADIILPSLGLPERTLTLVVVVALVGFPVAVALAWALQVTPGGVKPEAPAASGELEEIAAQPAAKRWPAGVLALVGVALLGGSSWWIRIGVGPSLGVWKQTTSYWESCSRSVAGSSSTPLSMKWMAPSSPSRRPRPKVARKSYSRWWMTSRRNSFSAGAGYLANRSRVSRP